MPNRSDLMGLRIVREILRNLEESAEPLLHSILVPAFYRVCLSQSDYRRLAGILPRIAADAALALTEELAKRNQPRFPISIPIGSLGSFGKAKYEPCGPDWEIRFYQDPNNELRAGELAVTSELTLPPQVALEGGLTVKRTVTSDTDRAEGIAPVVAPARAPSAEDDPTAPADGAIARIRFSGTLDNGTYQMSKDDILLGRGGNKHVDLRLNHPSVSRVHLRIRRLPGTSRFLVQNRGDYGATMNGTPIPRLEPDSEGGMEMPSRATIDLANQSVVLTFEAAAR